MDKDKLKKYSDDNGDYDGDGMMTMVLTTSKHFLG
jgi:hypothetical protein